MNNLLRMLLAFVASILALLSLPALAGEAEQAGETRTARPAPVRPALWKVSDKDTTIYLFGTIHVLPQGIDWFGGEVASAFERSGSLVTEVTDNDPARMQALLGQLAVLPQNQTLRGLLGERERADYEAALARYGMSPLLLDRFEPWYAAVALSTMPLMQEGFDASHGVEELLDAKARGRALPHSGLETAEYQLGLFDSLPQDAQRRYLDEVIAQLPTLKQEIAAMVEAWKRGDAEGLARIMNADESDPLLVKTLLTDRNKAWARWVHQRLDAPGTVFIAVGAGHLAGPGSVQEQLGALGIASERLQ